MAKRKENIFSDVFQIFLVFPWWVGPIVVIFVYFLFSIMLPACARQFFHPVDNSQTAIIANTLSPIAVRFLIISAPWLAGLVFLVWLVSILQKFHRGILFSSATDLSKIRALSWKEFEWCVGEYYRRNGFAVEERGGPSPDGGVDLVLRREGRKTIVQCKHWKKIQVGVKEVRELCGIVNHEQANAAILVTSGTFSSEATAFGEKNQIKLIDGATLNGIIQAVRGEKIADKSENVPQPKDAQLSSTAATQVTAIICPQCGAGMVLRTAKTTGSQFYGCATYPKCRGTRSLTN